MLQSHLERADKAVRQNLLTRQAQRRPQGGGGGPSTPGGKNVSKATKNFAILGYMVSSSLLLITNKLAVHNVPAPSLVLWSQMASAALVCFIFGNLGCLSVESLKWSKIKSFMLVSCIFLATIFTNIKILQYCNVETFIVFRASTPIAVSLGDYFCLGRQLPSIRSWICLVGLLIGAYIYMVTDSGYHVDGYKWVAIWYFVFCLDQLLIKHICNKVPFDSNWSRVYYTNLLTAIPLTFSFIIQQELANVQWTFYAWFFLLAGCALGLSMSYFAFLARHLVSAAYFTVLGNVCKVLTVIINFTIWDKHANMYGMAALALCLFCAYNYEQAPLRSENNKPTRKSGANTHVRRNRNLLPTNASV